MKLSTLILIAAGTLVVGTTLAQVLKPSPNPLTDFVLVDQFAYGVMPPHAIASDVQSLVPSDDRMKLVAVTKDATFQKSAKGKILIVDLKTGTQKSVLSYPESSVVKPLWIDDKAVLLQVTQQIKGPRRTDSIQSLVRVQLPNGRPENLLQVSDTEAHLTIYPLFVDGQTVYIANAFSLANDSEQNIAISSSGEPRVLSREAISEWKEKYSRQRFVVMPSEMNSILSGDEVDQRVRGREDEDAKRGLFLKKVAARSLDGTDAVRRTEWWLATDYEEWPTRKLVNTDGHSFLLPDLSAVISLNDGLLTKRSLIKVPKAEFLKSGEEFEKSELLSRVKQIGTGISLYVSDYDDEWPVTSGFGDIIDPYLKDRNITEGFEFLRPGKAYGDITDREKTRIGHIRGRFGRAYVNADNSVGWEKNN